MLKKGKLYKETNVRSYGFKFENVDRHGCSKTLTCLILEDTILDNLYFIAPAKNVFILEYQTIGRLNRCYPHNIAELASNQSENDQE